MKRLVYIGIAVNIIAAGVILFLAVCESPPSDSGSSTSQRSLLQVIHDKLASGQPLCWKDGKLSAEVVYFDDDGILILGSKGEERGVVFTKTAPTYEASVGEVHRSEDGTMMVKATRKPPTGATPLATRTSTMTARRIRIRIVGQKTSKMEFEFEDVVIKTEGSGVIYRTHREGEHDQAVAVTEIFLIFSHPSPR